MIRSKHREIWSVAARNIRRFPGRAIAIFVPIFVVMAYASAMTFLKDGVIREKLESIRFFPDITVSQFQAGRNVPVDPELAKEISSYDNVADAVLSQDQWDLRVSLKDASYADQVARAIFTAHKNVRASTRENFASLARQEYGRRSGVFQLMWQILLLTALLTAWAQSCSINLEMRKEIGILKTIGWHTLDIIELKMIEILIIGLSGLAAGIVCGTIFLYAGAPFIKEYFLGWQGSWGATVPVGVESSSVFLLFVIAIFPLCAATVVSAWRMGTVEPDSAIRS